MLAQVLLSVFMVMLAINAAESMPAINQAIRNKIEEMRLQMPCGINNGPPLVPYRHDLLEIDYNLDRMTANGFLRDIQVDHLDEFTVNQIEFNLLMMRLKFAFTMPKVHAVGHYNMSSTLVDGFELWGQGPFEVTAHNITLNGYLRLNLINGYMNMREFSSTLLMDAVTSNIEGILGGGEADDFYNNVIEQMVPELLQSNTAEVGRYISDSIMGPVNKVLNTMTLADLIGLQSHRKKGTTTNALITSSAGKTCTLKHMNNDLGLH